MNNKILVITIILIGHFSCIFPQQTFRRAAYLSQSIGTHIYWESLTNNVPLALADYNTTNGYTGDSACTIYNPTNDYPPGGNQMWKWQKAFYDSAGYSFKEDYLDTDTYNIIMVKFCAASQSAIWYYWYEGPQDTINYPETQSYYNYQWYIRKIVRKMEAYPNKFFFMWNIPAGVESMGSEIEMQMLADFNTWMTDTLQTGLDSYGEFPPNVRIFDFFNLLKSPYSNYMDSTYRDSPDDYHPNALASSVVAPILVQQMYDAAISYEMGGVTTFQLSVPIKNEWNLVSIPGLHPLNQNVNTWWINRDPTASVFRYDGSYQAVTSVSPGIGYCMKHLGVQTYNTGNEWPAGGIQVVAHNPIAGSSGWNLIGGYELSVGTSGIITNPPGLQNSPVYKYSTGYQVATTLDPGLGYFVKLTGAGQIIIPEALDKGTELIEYFPDNWGKIRLTDASGANYTLYSVNGEVDLSKYELPPAPMAGIFDIRFSSGRIAEDLHKSNQIIEMSGIVYPVILTVENMIINLQDESGNLINAKLQPGEQYKINNQSINKLQVAADNLILPNEYMLGQNYPNPFNPNTKIRFNILDAGKVKLTIYNVLGQEVRSLINEYKNPGVYTISFDASDLNSGMYIYTLEANGFTQTRKMVFIK